MKKRVNTKKTPVSPLTMSRHRNIRPARPSAKRKPTEAELPESEKRYRTLFDNIPIGLYRSTPGAAKGGRRILSPFYFPS